MGIRSAAPLLALTTLAACAGGRASAPAAAGGGTSAADHVLIVSVDGLRPDALAPAAALPAFARIFSGAATLDARCDPEWSVTLPNHVGMLTGRYTEGPRGHGWRLNDMPPPGLTLRAGQRSALHAAADAGLATAIFAGKPKFVLFPRSWNGVDQGDPSGVVRQFEICPDARATAQRLIAFWECGASRSLALIHFSEPDLAGHESGWDPAPGTPYSEAVAETDAALGTLLAWLDDRPERRARTAIVLSSDHGGGVPLRNHNGEGRALVNVRIPFAVWHGGGAVSGDLYALNAATRRAPEAADPGRETEGPPPIRNLDAAQTALALLGLPPLAGAAAPPLRLAQGAAR